MDVQWRIQLLGGLRAARADAGRSEGGRVVTRFRTRKTGALLAYLAHYCERAHPRDVLIELLWPEADPERGRQSLSMALSSLRHPLEPPGVPRGAVLCADRAAVQLNPDVVTTDVAEFEAALRAAARASSVVERVHHLSQAVERYQGELLPGYYEAWILPEQQRLAECFFQAVRELIQHREAAGDLQAAIQLACQAVSADRLREEAHAELIRLYAAAGHLNAALRQYQELERLLQQELGQPPSAATRTLARSIETRHLAPGSPDIGAPLVAPVAPAADAGPATAEPPVGTVTLLVTDIEGAPALWALLGKRFRRTLARHHELLRREFQRHGGYEVKESEDGFLVAFASAGEAVACAVAAQRALTAEAWPEAVGTLRVRMALHTGDVEMEKGEAHGPYPLQGYPLQHASRMALTAHGGQILCSETTANLLRRGDSWGLEPGVQLVNLGVYRLPEIPSQERLFQVSYPEMAQREFPPVLAGAGYASNLPLQLTRFFGREPEIARLHSMLLPDDQALGVRRWALKSDLATPNAQHPTPNAVCRLVTLTGPGGCGKTRLALAVADRLLEPYRGAVWFVPLGGIADPNRIVDVMRDALQLPRPPNVEPLEQVVVALSRQPALLVLDNFEHLLVPPDAAGAARHEGVRLVRTLLERLPTLTCLITSRRRLNLAGEREFRVPPLPVPGLTAHGGWLTAHSSQLTAQGEGPTSREPDALMQYPSVQLFVDRTQAVRPDFQVTEANAGAVAALCRRLEGIPLALELAGARAQVLTPAQILTHLESRIPFLESRQYDVEERQRSMRATLDWSYQLLSPELQRFFARLSVFRGGWTLEAAEAIGVEGEPALPGPALDYLEQLRECSLVEVEETGEQLRYFLMETLREYAWDRLNEWGEAETARGRHRDWFLSLAERLETEIHGPEQHRCLERLETEHENLRAALGACRIDGDVEKRQRLAGSLWKFWYAHGYFREGRQWLEEALAGTHGSALSRRKAFLGAATLAFYLGDYQAAEGFASESLASSREQEDADLQAQSLNLLGWVGLDRGEYGQAAASFDTGLACARQSGDRFSIALCLHSLGCLALREEQPAQAASRFEESLALFRQIDDAWGISLPLESLGRLALRAGDYQRVTALHEEVLERSRRLGHTARLARSLLNLGVVARHQGDSARAVQLLKESLALQRGLGGKQEIAECLEELAIASMDQQEGTRAARFFGAAEALREALGAAFQPSDRADHDQRVAAARARLGDSSFAAAWIQGRAMTLEQAVAEALGA